MGHKFSEAEERRDKVKILETPKSTCTHISTLRIGTQTGNWEAILIS